MFFIKLLLILSIICMILLMGIKINEKFQTDFIPESTKIPEPIKLVIDTNPQRNKFILSWKPSSKVDINEPNNKYFIIYYRNNIGPHIITLPNLVYSDKIYSYDFNNVEMNIEYRFAVIGKNSYGISNIEKYVKVKKTPPGLEIDYVTDIYTKIKCNANGSFETVNSKKCPKDDIIQAQTLDENGNLGDFDYDYHDEMIRNMSYRPSIEINLD